MKFTHFILLFACRICRIEINFIILALSMNYEQSFQNGIVYIFRCYHVHLYSYLILIPVCYDFYYDTTFFFFSSGTDKKTLFNPNTCLFTILIRTSDNPSSIVLVAGFRVNINFMAYFLQNDFFIFVLKCRILVYVGANVVSSLSL